MSARVATLADLEPGTPHRVEVDGEPVALVRLDDGASSDGGHPVVKAVHDTCSHQEASLSEGEIWDGEIECFLHGSTFSLDTGAPSCLPATTPVPTYAVTVEGDDVYVDATEPTNGAPVPDHG